MLAPSRVTQALAIQAGKSYLCSMQNEFEEVAHSGGKVTLTITTTADGQRHVQMSISSSRPVPMSLIALYAVPPGIPITPVKHLGLSNMEGPPFPECVLVLIASDSHGLFGHLCPRCRGYWRSGPWPTFCPYCAVEGNALNFLSEAQSKYIDHYCDSLTKAMSSLTGGEVVIDMDAVADAVADPARRPSFYVSEESQQHKFKCKYCNAFNDIIGTYGYCCQCATRNDLAVFEDEKLSKLRERLNSGGEPEDCVRDAVAAIDNFIGQYSHQIAKLVPLVKRRETRLLNGRFHDFSEVAGLFAEWFGIDLVRGIKTSDVEFATLMFHRRHLYEHKGGEADEKYIKESGEPGVRLKQRLRNSQEDAHRLIGILQRLASNLHAGFHELFPPAPEPIAAWQERQARAKRTV